MEKFKYIVARLKLNNTLVKVRQKEPFSNQFVDTKGNIFNIKDIDITIDYFLFDKNNVESIEENGLDGYRVIYG